MISLGFHTLWENYNLCYTKHLSRPYLLSASAILAFSTSVWQFLLALRELLSYTIVDWPVSQLRSKVVEYSLSDQLEIVITC